MQMIVDTVNAKNLAVFLAGNVYYYSVETLAVDSVERRLTPGSGKDNMI